MLGEIGDSLPHGLGEDPSGSPDLRSTGGWLDGKWDSIYSDLRALAIRALAAERPGHTLQPTALVHELYGRLVSQRTLRTADRAEFMAAAANTLRRILVDHARAHNAAKRGGGGGRVALEAAELTAEAAGASPTLTLDLLDLETALAALAASHPRAARVVELRFFGGLSAPEAAAALGVSERLVFDDWSFARAFLRRAMAAERRERA